MAELKPMKKEGQAACPTCGKPLSEAHRPFCSDRCKDVDLNRWLQGSYAIPAVEEPDPDEEDMAEVLSMEAHNPKGD